MSDKLNYLKMEEVVQHLRETLDEEVQQLVGDIAFLQVQIYFYSPLSTFQVNRSLSMNLIEVDQWLIDTSKCQFTLIYVNPF